VSSSAPVEPSAANAAAPTETAGAKADDNSEASPTQTEPAATTGSDAHATTSIATKPKRSPRSARPVSDSGSSNSNGGGGSAPLVPSLADLELHAHLSSEVSLLSDSVRVLQAEVARMRSAHEARRAAATEARARNEEVAALRKQHAAQAKQEATQRAQREIAAFKQRQLLGDLTAAASDLRRALSERVQRAQEVHQSAELLRREGDTLELEYAQLQAQLDHAVARHRTAAGGSGGGSGSFDAAMSSQLQPRPPPARHVISIPRALLHQAVEG